ncbi:hypothetical protein [Brevibacillus brevis]|uniref:hypothetical protein n=1 Tax=Brevibacillus brevis TaxID=1393 RepID=UPI0007D8B3B0|nr:hypothetical protein [Brevibacillus brevis]
MDRHTYFEEEQKKVGQCICGDDLFEGDRAHQLDEYIVCDNSDCFKKLCIEKFGAMYGVLDKEGNVT